MCVLQGYPDHPVYDGEYIANKTETIVVILSYRVGALGFLNFKDKDGTVIRGNFGIKVCFNGYQVANHALS
jgi:carboxylesterase type B